VQKQFVSFFEAEFIPFLSFFSKISKFALNVWGYLEPFEVGYEFRDKNFCSFESSRIGISTSLLLRLAGFEKKKFQCSELKIRNEICRIFVGNEFSRKISNTTKELHFCRALKVFDIFRGNDGLLFL
jgi:hypothetical protein